MKGGQEKDRWLHAIDFMQMLVTGDRSFNASFMTRNNYRLSSQNRYFHTFEKHLWGLSFVNVIESVIRTCLWILNVSLHMVTEGMTLIFIAIAV